MSGAFGSNNRGHFWQQIENAASDCLGGRYELTRLFGQLFRSMQETAYEISHAEAEYCGEEDVICRAIREMDVKAAVASIEAYLDPYRRVAKKAAEEAIRDLKAKQEPGP